VDTIKEVALEVSPDTVEKDKFQAYRAAGINRVNIGVQSTINHELSIIGRHYLSDVPFKALKIVQEVGFDNVCVDLIYGLEGQSFKDWCDSVIAVLEYSPETICAYSLTLRPATGFDRRGYRSISGEEQYRKYDYVNETLQNAGYKQETQVRWVKNDKGGYIQKANHWALQNLLGLGAGARSYLWELDTRNGYSVRQRKRAFEQYLKNVDETGHSIVDGFVMDDDERMRKAVILGLIKLDRIWFAQQFGHDPLAVFLDEFTCLSDLNLLDQDGQFLKLTPLGIRHRDVVVQRFFSDRVKTLLSAFEYNE
jgi:oxygen-independent coproporphyrinogen-3 oxidase